MTILFRILALVSAFLAIVFILIPIMIVGHGVFLVLGALAIRCTMWLWRKRRFWTEIRSLSEVAALACFLLLWPIEALLEQHTDGLAKDVLHIATVLVVVTVYVFIQRHGRTSNTSETAS